jgi:hypothetical protein
MASAAQSQITMAAASWILQLATFNGSTITATDERSLAGWGFSNGRLHRENLQPDRLTFTRAVERFDDAPPIAYGQLVVLIDPQGVQRFVGTRIVVPASASASEELQQYEFRGPWYWLQRIVYRQSWQQLLINGQLVSRTTSHLLLNGTDFPTVADQVTAVAEFAISQGAPFALGTIDIPIRPFVTEITDQNCAAVIADQLRFAPDAVAWFDYSQAVPTLNVRQAHNLEAVSLSLGPGQRVLIADDGLTITPRPDEQVTSVSLRYERTDTLDDKQYLRLDEDVYPQGSDGSGLNAIHATIPLAGYNKTTIRASIFCEAIDTADVNWWKRVIPKLTDTRIKNLTISNVQRVIANSRTEENPAGDASSEFGRFLVEGQLAEWMADVSEDALQWEQEEISADFSFDLDVDPTSGEKLEKVQKLRIPVQLVATTAPAGESSYWATQSEEEGETAPAGLAQYLYQSLNPLQYEGSVTTVQPETTGYIGPGNSLNILGTQDAGHASMAARVQSVDELIDTGTTFIQFGPNPSLSLGAILEFMRATRHRRRWTRQETQETGENATEMDVQLGQATANLNTVEGDRQNKLFACVDTLNRIELDASQRKLTLETGGQPAKAVLQAYNLESTATLVGGDTGIYATLMASGSDASLNLNGTNGRILCQTTLCKGKQLYPREETWCDPTTGARRKIMVIASDPYD